jgi:acyl-CoA thioesterase-2
MTTQVESAWPSHPEYRIDIAPCEYVGQVWCGDVLLAESENCLVVTETEHVERLYFPQSDVSWDLFTAADHTTVCPFKGQASYWNLNIGDVVIENVAWSYPTPLTEVAGIGGYVSFYDDSLRVVVVERWPDGSEVPAKFPLWGDANELVRLVDVEPVDKGRFVGPAHGPTRRDVVEGGQLLAEAIVATSKTVPNQRVTSASMVFMKAASFTAPVDIAVEMLRTGRTFSTAEVRATQHGTLRGAAILLCDSGASNVIGHVLAMPDVPQPSEAVPFEGFAMPGREIRIVDDAYDPDPERVGPPEINAWLRFRNSPDQPYLHAALLAQSTTHWTIAAGMLPHRGFGEAQAHRTLSTGIMNATVAFHEEVDVTEWLLYANRAFWSGRGLIQGDGQVFTRDGRLAASYNIQAMVRAFERGPESMGHDDRTAM